MLRVQQGEHPAGGCVALTEEASAYRVRVRDYRIVYEVQDAVLLVQGRYRRRISR